MAMRLAVLALLAMAVAAQEDVECLREIKSSVTTAGEYLQSWDFNTSAANICNFLGVQCLHPSEIKVYSLSLPGAGLHGSFPRGLRKCSSLTGLDLSSNFFTGPIPADLCQMLPYLVKLDLSQNNISGIIPQDLSQCLYLNQLRLQRNRLEGGIPGQIGLLPRLRDFNVADNRLSGPIPYTFHAFTELSFAGNEALCGAPLGANCKGGAAGAAAAHRAARARTAVVAGVAAGGTLALLAACFLCCWVVLGGQRRRRKSGAELEEELLDNAWLRRIKSPSAVLVSMFEQPIVKIRLSDIAAATAGFSRDAVIAMSRTGVFYKATLRDGSVLAVKKLRRAAMHSAGEKHFRSEMEALAKVRHRNLVPLLGYCIAGNERLLVYKHMPCGNLFNRLHTAAASTPGDSSSGSTSGRLDWAARLKVAVGTARGLAWLHHSCNPRLVHKGITSASILLDEDLEPRITDFGLARLIVTGRGRPGGAGGKSNSDEDGFYVPPEDYSTTYSLSRATSMSAASTTATPKGDVYAFGVVLLELVTGRRPNDGNAGVGGGGGGGGGGDTGDGGGDSEGGVAARSSSSRRSLVDWIGELFKSGHVSEAVDPSLVAEASVLLAAGNGDSSNGSSGRRREVMQVLKIACSCVLSFPKERPSMYEVYHMLRAVGEDYYPVENLNPLHNHARNHQFQQQQRPRRSGRKFFGNRCGDQEEQDLESGGAQAAPAPPPPVLAAPDLAEAAAIATAASADDNPGAAKASSSSEQTGVQMQRLNA
ncbi:probable inactive receptor kinase At1g27190 [Selaginella moellendorffii]|uniref:probable inactive receptor kinase At1g27190 n=1 Tax=Selaginella moellendorffii TaxID=88036 RepID=UPI000D1C7BD2|nr:probable inactive receptor kinase At1g27190 [Selaginella moellendorffii]|eukprot:XP_024525466.1 probable inactive receptor kinase At1g27190 [Selaginella moellendorffii]